MKLERLTDRVWFYPNEQERDRPVLGYIRGDNYSLAIDAGHSDAHTAEFYDAIKEEGLQLPSLTVITHWHWDHTFGMHAINGLSIANSKTNEYLRDFRERIEKNGLDEFFNLDISIRREYAGNRPVKIVTSDIEFSGEMIIDVGGCKIRAFQAEAPHTDDSTLVEVVDEKVLFLGDSVSGVFPTWVKDSQLSRKLADTIEKVAPKYCVDGHWVPTTMEDTIADLLAENS